MSRARRIWKWTAAMVAVLLVLAGAGLGVLRIWLEQSTTLVPSVVARLEQASGLRLEFSKLDARLGLYGPELVFREARLYAPGERDPLAFAGAGRVGIDWWRMLRTGRLAAGRVTLDRARLHVLVTPTGVELLHQGPLWRDERRKVRLDRLPVGHVKIDDATVVVEDTRTRLAPVRLEDVDLEIERNPSALTVALVADLPRALGSRVTLDGSADGDLGVPEALAWRANLALRDARLGGFAPFVATSVPVPSAGSGDLRVDARGRGIGAFDATARFAFDGVALPPAGPTRTTYRRLAGELGIVRTGARWSLVGRELEVDPGRDAWHGGRFDVAFDLDEGALSKLVAKTPDLQLAALAPLAALVPAGPFRDAALALAPRGRLQALDATLTRGDLPGEWRIDGGGRFAGLGIGVWHRVPGFAGLDGEFTGRGAEGRFVVRTKGFDLDLPEFLTGRVSAREGGATVDWWWKPDGWRFATDDLRAIAPDGRGGGKARLWLPSVDERGPTLVLDLAMSDIDARGVPKYLPARRLSPATVSWLDHAFLGGRVATARLTYAGAIRRFPFRDGGGEFRVTANYEGLKVHYQDGWDDLEDVTGEITFLNAGFDARVSKARVRGIVASTGTASMADFRDAALVVRAEARGDLRDGLGFLQQSPVGPRLGRYFMALAARGPMEARVALDLPLKRFADRVVAVDARFERASAKLPNVDDDVRALAGTLRLRNRDVEVPEVSGTLLGGPFKASAKTVDGARGERVLTVQAEGRATGAKLQPVIAITHGNWLDGTFDWTASGRIPRLEWRSEPLPVPADAPPGTEPVPREPEVRWLPMTFRADATLAGLAIRLPVPMTKPADEARSARVDFVVDPGVDAAAPPPPRARGVREAPRPTTLVARASSGRDAAVLTWRYDDAWAFERASVRLGGGAPALREGRGLWIDGRVPDLDLSAWLRVRLTPPPPSGSASDPAAGGLAALLKGGSVVADRFSVLGFAFPNVTMQLEGRDKAWRAQVDGPATRGRIVVPFDLLRGDPLVLDMDRLVVADRDAPAGGDAEPATDPRELPALQITVRNLEVWKRRFGSLQANVVRTTDGLRLDRGTLQGASFDVEGRGAWTWQPAGSASRVHVEAKSTDVLDTLNAWGFAPSISGKSGTATADFHWNGGPEGDVLARLNGAAKVQIESGQLLTVEPGAGRVLGLMSVGALPRRLTLDFTDLTDKGLAYDSITGDFEFRDGNAHTSNLLLKSPAAEIGIVGRTGLAARDYDQTAVVTGHLGGPIAAAGAIAAGPAIGAALLLFSKVFKEPLSGMARGYYRITGSWDKPKVERVGAREAESTVVGDTGRDGAK